MSAGKSEDTLLFYGYFSQLENYTSDEKQLLPAEFKRVKSSYLCPVQCTENTC